MHPSIWGESCESLVHVYGYNSKWKAQDEDEKWLFFIPSLLFWPTVLSFSYQNPSNDGKFAKKSTRDEHLSNYRKTIIFLTALRLSKSHQSHSINWRGNTIICLWNECSQSQRLCYLCKYNRFIKSQNSYPYPFFLPRKIQAKIIIVFNAKDRNEREIWCLQGSKIYQFNSRKSIKLSNCFYCYLDIIHVLYNVNFNLQAFSNLAIFLRISFKEKKIKIFPHHF